MDKNNTSSPHTQLRFRQLLHDPALWMVLATAGVLRLYRPGVVATTWDETNLLYWSRWMVENSRLLLRSNQRTSVAGLTHSAFSNYVFALPYFITDNPIAARVLMGIMSTTAVAVVYLVMRRYFGKPAAVFGGMLLAVNIIAVEWGRFAWNPNVAPLFQALWLLTAFAGVMDDNRAARIASWPLLALTVHAHPSYVFQFIPAALLVIAAWATRRVGRKRLLTDTLIGLGLATLTFVPWGLGVCCGEALGQPIASVSDTSFSADSLSGFHLTLPDEEMLAVYAEALSGFRHWAYWLDMSGPNLWPPLRLDRVVLLAQAVAAVLGSLALAGLAVARRRWEDILAGSLGVSALVPLLGPVFMSDAGYFHYFTSGTMAAVLLTGLLLARLYEWRPSGRVVSAALLGVMVLIHGWIVAAYLHWNAADGWGYEPLRAPMAVQRELIAGWTDGGTHPAVFIVDMLEGKHNASMQLDHWAVYAADVPMRRVNRFEDDGIAIPPGESTLVSLAGGPTIPAIFGEGEVISNFWGEPAFRLYTITPEDIPAVDLLPTGPDQFASGAKIVGVSAPTDPQAGEAWPVTLVWEITDVPVEQLIMQFSLRIFDAEGRQHAQHDIRSLSTWEWHTGDRVINPQQIEIGPDYPAGSPPRIELLMYTWPDIQNIDVVDEAGNPTGQIVTLEK